MLASEVTWLAFAVFSGLRTISYVPQIVRIAKDHNGASAISYPTWLLWTGAHVSTGMYAAMNLNDVWLAVGSSIYGLCCIIVIILTMFKRLAQHRTKDRHQTQGPGPSMFSYRAQSA
jgi:fumarate reductase subunit D